jgi:hypothetical protein
MKALLRSLLGMAIMALIVAGLAWFFLSDPNRFKPQIEGFIEEQSGIKVDLGVDLSWKLFPPLALSASGVSAEYEGTVYELAAMQVDVDLMSVVRNRDINQWEVTALTLADLEIAQEDSLTHVETFRIDNFQPGRPSPFSARLTQRTGEEPPLPLKVNGMIAADPQTRTLALTSTRFETDAASGTCNLDANLKDPAAAGANIPEDPEEALIPVSIWRTVDWQGTCDLDRLVLLEETFDRAAVSLNNRGGNSTTKLEIPDFFDGSAAATVDINASADPVRWRIEPDLARADSTELMAWLNQRLKWIAPLAYSGEIRMTGNTTEDLIRSVQGTTNFDGGQGRIDIAQIKQPLLGLANLFQEGERIAAWPDLWNYERLIGEWNIDGIRHELDLALDNLTAGFRGTYDPLTDALNMNVEFLFEDNPDLHSFDVNPVLVGLPIPLTCTGSLEAPACKVNAEATRNLVAAVLTSEQGSAARAQIDQAIDEKVPEEYREAARGLLDILGESLKERPKEDN